MFETSKVEVPLGNGLHERYRRKTLVTRELEKGSHYRSRTGKCGNARTTAPERSEGHRVPVQKEGRGGSNAIVNA